MFSMKELVQKIAKGRRYSTLWMALQRRLYRLGINIVPFYLVQEGHHEIEIPGLKDNVDDYQFEFLTPQDMKTIGQSEIIRGDEAQFNAWLAKGWKCLGAKHRGEIVAYAWIDLEECHFPGQTFRLKNNEAYLFNMYTAVPYRGKNIAAYIRYETYRALKEMGRDTFYSISESLNKPSIKFKQKLKAELLKKGLFIELFNKIRFSIPLKTYKDKLL
jgi:GNAT superfamily N-acetyltransferase